MHIPAEMLNGQICPVTATVAALTLSAAGAWAYTHRSESFKQSALKFAGVSAIVFALQALNFPIMSGVSGHFVGGVLAAALLGVPCGVLCMAAVLAVQAFLLGDGGVDALGANVLNMAVIGAGLGGAIRLGLNKLGTNNLVSTGIAAAAGVMMAVVGVAVEFAICGKGSMELASALMVAHLPMAMVEGVLASALYAVLTGELKSAKSVRLSTVATIAVLVVAVVLLPLASTCPDGLEATIQQFGL